MFHIPQGAGHLLLRDEALADQIGADLLSVRPVHVIQRLAELFRGQVSLHDERIAQHPAVAPQLFPGKKRMIRLRPFDAFPGRLFAGPALFPGCHPAAGYSHLNGPPGRDEVDDVTIDQPEGKERRKKAAEEDAAESVDMIQRIGAEGLADDRNQQNRQRHKGNTFS